MEKTKCLYDKLPYETEFDANVLAVKALEEAQDRYEVILDQTLFFPEQGGQTPDQGWLSVGHGLRPAIRCKVQDVQIRDGVIVHVIEQKLEAGDQVHGQIDWDYRFSNMQQHTGEHSLRAGQSAGGKNHRRRTIRQRGQLHQDPARRL